MRNALATILLLLAGTVSAQLTMPPDGGNQRSSVTQYLGLVKVTIDYNSPRVHNPHTGEDRRGKIWGKLVPYGLVDLGFGTCKECPWRAGANENTVFTVSHDVKIEGRTLPAGTYGLHMIPNENEWTIVFSKNSKSWGSFFYDPAEDALRVNVKPVKSEYHEWLTYEFPQRELDKATAELAWEDLAVPFTISVDNINDLYLAEIRNELRGEKGFQWQNWSWAARFALDNKDVKEGLEWAKVAASPRFPGQLNFSTLSTLADLQAANGLEADAKKTRESALNHVTASAVDLHQYARQLLSKGKKEDAMAVWQLNAKRHPNEWPVNVGLARGNSALGKYDEALRYAKLALAQAPDEMNRGSLAEAVKKLESGKDMNQ
ncbi:MAG TPA: DUF2911 domain-containing protein [Thermoanaerobaculia bacterium]|nr:DUF2911 domain-containing protein [Thermoanaerobaculia bacterium]